MFGKNNYKYLYSMISKTIVDDLIKFVTILKVAHCDKYYLVCNPEPTNPPVLPDATLL